MSLSCGSTFLLPLINLALCGAHHCHPPRLARAKLWDFLYSLVADFLRTTFSMELISSEAYFLQIFGKLSGKGSTAKDQQQKQVE